MKELREFTFHSRHLVPFEIGQKGIDAIIEWIEEKQQKHRFEEGDEVCHKDHPEEKMYVKEIIKEMKTFRNGSDSKGNPLFKSKIRMIGISCYYYAPVKDTV